MEEEVNRCPQAGRQAQSGRATERQVDIQEHSVGLQSHCEAKQSFPYRTQTLESLINKSVIVLFSELNIHEAHIWLLWVVRPSKFNSSNHCGTTLKACVDTKNQSLTKSNVIMTPSAIVNYMRVTIETVSFKKFKPIDDNS